ncbi:MAG: hypothetical protein Fur0010_16460 [Bdellovibrio sp.]
MADVRTCEQLVDSDNSMNDIYRCQVTSLVEGEGSIMMDDIHEVCVGLNEFKLVVSFRNQDQGVKYFLYEGVQGQTKTSFDTIDSKFEANSVEKVTMGRFTSSHVRRKNLKLMVAENDQIKLEWLETFGKKNASKKIGTKVTALCQ